MKGRACPGGMTGARIAPVIDSHAHLYFEDYTGDPEAPLKRFLEAGGEAVVNVGTTPANSAWVRDFARKHPGTVFATAGIHPQEVEKATAGDWDAFEALARSGGFVAIGETGLDYHRPPMTEDVKDKQKAFFRQQVALAVSLDLPVVIHNRESDADVLAVIDEFGGKARGVFHCFGSDLPMALEVVRRGFLVSFSGILTFPKAANLHEAARGLPLGSLLVETDCPFLSPVPHRGKTNEPAFVALTIEALAKLQGLEPEAVRRATADNARRMFRI